MRSDGELVAIVRRHDAAADAAFRELYERHKDEAFTLLMRILRERSLAEDVLQEAFFRVYLSLDRFDPERSFRAWLQRIVRNAAIDALRTRTKEKRIEEDRARATGAASGDTVREVAEREAAARARAALLALPDEPRALLIQRHGSGLQLSELAESWACSERTIVNRLREAAGLLVQALGRGRA